MKIICIMVASLNGFTTDGTDSSIHSWTSKEDQEYFAGLIDRAELILMGRHTYEAAKAFMQHRPGRLRIVFTKNPENYKDMAIPGQLEFTDESPNKVVKNYNLDRALLLGGATLNTAFIKDNLVDELWVTIEPIVLNGGNPLFADLQNKKNAKLLSMEKLNNKGTLLLKYKLSSRTCDGSGNLVPNRESGIQFLFL